MTENIKAKKHLAPKENTYQNKGIKGSLRRQ